MKRLRGVWRVGRRLWLTGLLVMGTVSSFLPSLDSSVLGSSTELVSGGIVSAMWQAPVQTPADISDGDTDGDTDEAAARRIRQQHLEDPLRPVWHLTLPEGVADPFDPNGAICQDGVYHLWYIYQPDPDRPENQWCHVSTRDLFHWRWHPFILRPEEGTPEKGINSGNAWKTPDGRVVISYQGVQAGGDCAGNCVIMSDDPDLDFWRRSASNPTVAPCADTHMWFEYGDSPLSTQEYDPSHSRPVDDDRTDDDRKPAAPEGSVYLINGGRSPTLWVGDSPEGPMEMVGPFLSHEMAGVQEDEDISCPDFFRLGNTPSPPEIATTARRQDERRPTDGSEAEHKMMCKGDKWVLMCISHPEGARYYIGTWDGRQFTPQSHHRMNWPGGCCFAPETLEDETGRRICWVWLRGDPPAWRGAVMSMPRVLTLSEDQKSLKFSPPREIESLRFRHRSCEPRTVEAGTFFCPEGVEGRSMELDLRIDPGQAKRFGVQLFRSGDGREETPIVFDSERQTVSIQLEKSSLNAPPYHQYFLYREPNPVVTEQVVPTAIPPGEKIRLRIFLDRSTIEIFVNDSQCISQLVYPTLPESQGVSIFAEDAAIQIESLDAWELFPTQPW